MKGVFVVMKKISYAGMVLAFAAALLTLGSPSAFAYDQEVTIVPKQDQSGIDVYEGHYLIKFQLSLPDCYNYRNIAWDIPSIGELWVSHATTDPKVEGSFIDYYEWTTPDAPPTSYSLTVRGQRRGTCGSGGGGGDWEDWSSTVAGGIDCEHCGECEP